MGSRLYPGPPLEAGSRAATACQEGQEQQEQGHAAVGHWHVAVLQARDALGRDPRDGGSGLDG